VLDVQGGNIGAVSRIILREIIKRLVVKYVDWSDLVQDRVKR
jgi:hypothetical protein